MSRRAVFMAVAAVTFGGQLAAAAYEVIVAARFGTGPDAAALALTLILVLAVVNEILGWISALFVPHYLAALTAGDVSARRFFLGCAAALTLVTGALAAAVAWAAPAVVAVLAPTLPGPSVSLLREFSPLLVVLPLVALVAGVLQAHERFVTPALRQLFWYGGALIALGVAGGRWGPAAVPLGMLVGLVAFAALLLLRLPPAKAGSAAEPVGPRLLALGAPLLPLAIASAANYVNVSVERGVAARLPEGSLPALTYAFRVLNVPVNLFLLSATTMLFTPLAAQAARGAGAEVEALTGRALRLAVVFTAPLAALAIALAEPAVRVVFERGAFTSESTVLTAVALAWYAPAIVGMAVVHVLSRVYQALREIGRQVVVGIAVIALNVALMPLLSGWLGLRGLPLATTINWTLLAIAMLLAVRPRLRTLDLSGLANSSTRALLASGLAMASAWAVARLGWGGDAFTLLAGGAAGAVAYVLALLALAPEDARLALALVAPRLPGRSPARP